MRPTATWTPAVGAARGETAARKGQGDRDIGRPGSGPDGSPAASLWARPGHPEHANAKSRPAERASHNHL